MPPHREPLGPRTNPARDLSIWRGSAGWHSSPRAHPFISAYSIVLRLAKMSAKAEVGLAKEASRQILAGGSAGKAAPPRPAPPGASRFPFGCPENVSQTSLSSDVLSPSSKFCAAGAEPEPAEPESKGVRGRRRASGCSGLSRRGARGGSSRVPRLLGS